MSEARRSLPAAAGPGGAAALAAALLVAIGLVEVEALAAGLLSAWITALSVCTGASVWLLIAALTGGVWPRAGEVTLAALAKATPLVALFGIVIFLLGPVLYPWWQGSEGLRGAVYLVPWSFALRGALILGLWSAIGWLAQRRLPEVMAALLLLAYGITVGIGGLDWILSRDPEMLSTTLGMLLAAMQLGLALAACALAGLDERHSRAVADWGGLMLATCLGTFYLGAMQYIVSWSGNLPTKAEWFTSRSDGAGTLIMVLIVLTGAALPFGVLIGTARRGSALWLRRVASAMLIAGYLHFVWLCAPAHMVLAAVAGAAPLAALGLFAAAWQNRRSRE